MPDIEAPHRRLLALKVFTEIMFLFQICHSPLKIVALKCSSLIGILNGNRAHLDFNFLKTFNLMFDQALNL